MSRTLLRPLRLLTLAVVTVSLWQPTGYAAGCDQWCRDNAANSCGALGYGCYSLGSCTGSPGTCAAIVTCVVC